MFEIFAYVERMKYIRRWALMRSLRDENDMEHSFQVAYVAHALALLRNERFGGNVDVGRVLEIALYHDLSETVTGDMPTPVKYFNPEMRALYNGLEATAEKRLLSTLPEDLKTIYAEFISPDTDSAEYRIVKAADKISAYLKCVEETKSGNTEFRRAMDGKREELMASGMAEVIFFMEHIVPIYSLTLDELDITASGLAEVK